MVQIPALPLSMGTLASYVMSMCLNFSPLKHRQWHLTDLSALRTWSLIHNRAYIVTAIIIMCSRSALSRYGIPMYPASYCQLTFWDVFFPIWSKPPWREDSRHYRFCFPYDTCLKDGRYSAKSGLKCHYLKIKTQPVSPPENSSMSFLVADMNDRWWLWFHFPTNMIKVGKNRNHVHH